MQQDEEFHACPNADCSWGVLLSATHSAPDVLTRHTGAFFAKGEGNIFVCQLCSVRHCLSCNVPFHEDQTCEEYLAAERKEIADERTDAGRRKTEETASLAFLKTMSKPCPQCGTNLDKYDGMRSPKPSSASLKFRSLIQILGCDHVICKLEVGLFTSKVPCH